MDEKYLTDRGWVKREVKYNAFGHKTRTAWTHPSLVFKRPVNYWTAYEFQEKYEQMKKWDPEFQGF